MDHSPLTSTVLSGPFTRVLIELRWGDMDAYRHVNNVTQLRILEEARVRAFGSPTAARDSAPVRVPGVGESVLGEPLPGVLGDASADTDLLVLSHRIEYREPIPYREGPVAVDCVISAVSPVSMTVGYVIAEPDGSVAYTVAETVVVFVDSATGRARRIRDDERARLEPAITAPVPLRHV
ncbi:MULTISPECIES: acyl-CoA thioesterase [Brevibacterium]|uniref:Thioesterase family protein n=1 Tax=Brevibacterium salitolerans TaxID=1403566 RepID=A0ABN2WBV7_9MICO|nr:thioesterase family protein [Brevibacterium sp.]